MTSIFESKIYASLSQDRKDKIKAAYLNPVNVELVQQLSSYLHQTIEDEPVEDIKEEPNDVKDSDVDKNDEGSVEHSHTSSPKKTLPSMNKLVDHLNEEGQAEGESSENFDTDKKTDEEGKESQLNSEPVIDEFTPEKEPTESSTSINASCNLPEVDLDTIKGTLNAREDTTGVTQIRRRENEIWIYYGDKVNLNNILPFTIDIIAAIDQKLEFNRLARSNNAIVFEVVLATTYPTEVSDGR